jgi:drug/metabolite transporter (DMT)-like permease
VAIRLAVIGVGLVVAGLLNTGGLRLIEYGAGAVLLAGSAAAWAIRVRRGRSARNDAGSIR